MLPNDYLMNFLRNQMKILGFVYVQFGFAKPGDLSNPWNLWRIH